MSTLAYGALTRKREEADPGTSKSREAPGLKPYIDALTALVPAEVLVFHAAMLPLMTATKTNKAGEAVTTITHPGQLSAVFWIGIILSIAFYVVGHTRVQWDTWDYIRMLVPAVAFVGWTVGQKSTAFDAVWPGLDDVSRSLAAAVIAIVLGLFSGTVSAEAADQKAPTVRRTVQ